MKKYGIFKWWVKLGMILKAAAAFMVVNHPNVPQFYAIIKKN